MEPKIFVATKAIVVYDGKVLILREAGEYDDGTNEGRYDVPGGRLRPGEQFAEALKREVFEETGLSINIGDPIAVGEWRPVVKEEPWQVVGTFFLCEAPVPAVKLSPDHDGYEWIDPKEYKKYPLIGNLENVFEKYLKKLGQ